MLNAADNERKYHGPIHEPLETVVKAYNGSAQCKRAVGAGYYSDKEDKTFFCYSGEGMDVYVGTYDHQEGRAWEDCVCHNAMFGRWDYHNYANMVPTPDGEKAIFFVHHTRGLYQLTAPTWAKRKISDDFACYPTPVVADGKIYLFYARHENEVNGDVVDGVWQHPYRSLRYMVSEDSGRTWSEAKTVMDTQKLDGDKLDEVYLCGAEHIGAQVGLPERIQLSWSMWGGVKGHASSNRSAFMAYLSLEDYQLYSADGTCLGGVIDAAAMKAHCLIYEAEAYDGTGFHMASVLSTALKDGRLMAVYGVLEEGRGGTVRSAIYEDGRWQETIIAEGTYSVKDIDRNRVTGAIKIVYAHGDRLVVSHYDEASGHWVKASVTPIYFEEGANSLQFINFIDDHREDFSLLAGQMANAEVENLYRGIWPMTGYGIRKKDPM